MSTRVVISGVGAVTAIGTDTQSFWRAALAGRSGVGPISRFDTSEFRVKIAAQVEEAALDLGSGNGVPAGKQGRLALAAARQALGNAGVGEEILSRERVGVVMGCLFGEPLEFEAAVKALSVPQPSPKACEEIGRYPHTSFSQGISLALGATGPSETLYCACSSGNAAIARACTLIASGAAELVIAGGADVLNKGIFGNFLGLRLLAKEACRPFDQRRDGLVFGEGAGVVVIQSLAAARRRRSPIWAEIVGYGLSCDAHHLSSPHPQARGLLSAMHQAMTRAGLTPQQIDYVSAHGTGTRINDRVETAALRRYFADHADNLAISSVKSMIGHTMGAASALEAVVCCLALRDQALPPTINYQTPDSDCTLDCIPNQMRRAPVKVCMSNSLGFGGINGSLILRRYGGD